jgi:hypothetical protein
MPESLFVDGGTRLEGLVRHNARRGVKDAQRSSKDTHWLSKEPQRLSREAHWLSKEAGTVGYWLLREPTAA